jgi:biotin/methionine sulfoxide reductase
MNRKSYLTANHWGTYWAEVEGSKLVGMRAFEEDPDPSPIGHGIVDVLDGPTRIRNPMIRKSWLEGGPGTNTHLRGQEAFIEVDWPTVEEIVAKEIVRVRDAHGANAIYGGSYGWASAGRFHHAQSQLERFLNCCGGFTTSVFTYSFAAAEAMIPHVLGSYREFLNKSTSWGSVAQDGELVVAFGGIPLKNAQLEAGGLGAHRQREGMLKAHAAGVKFVSISPLKQDTPEELDAEWWAPRPNSDVAIMLGLAHTLYVEGLHDSAFLERCCVGFEIFSEYLTGKTDGVVKDADWAAELSEFPADEIRALARRMSAERTVISVSWSLTRQDHGEQPFWMAITLASMLGQIGQPGGGFVFGYSAVNSVGGDFELLSGGSLPQGQKGVPDFIPVSRISDLLLNPGKVIDFNGQKITYPDIRMVWWAGGNPFHHHQDLTRLAEAWQKPDTIICNEWCWNPLAKRSDIVLPCTTHVERNDVVISQRDPYLIRVEKAVDAPSGVRDDYEIFSGIACWMNLGQQFTEGRTADDWIRWIYEKTTMSDGKVGDLASTEVVDPGQLQEELSIPRWSEFCEKRWLKLAVSPEPRVMLRAFVEDPVANSLGTPSGKIEIFSQRVASFGYEDCGGHPEWHEPYEWLGNASPDDLHLISNQPRTKLHSQLDHGSVSRAGKIDGREPLLMNPGDAAARGIGERDVVRVFNERGSCLAVAQLSADVRPGLLQMSTGAWWDPDETGLCRHGNPNVLTRDKGTSSLGQGPTAHTCLVKVERFPGTPPPVRAYAPPDIEKWTPETGRGDKISGGHRRLGYC